MNDGEPSSEMKTAVFNTNDPLGEIDNIEKYLIVSFRQSAQRINFPVLLFSIGSDRTSCAVLFPEFFSEKHLSLLKAKVMELTHLLNNITAEPEFHLRVMDKLKKEVKN